MVQDVNVAAPDDDFKDDSADFADRPSAVTVLLSMSTLPLSVVQFVKVGADLHQTYIE
jgi:hypothetical protein